MRATSLGHHALGTFAMLCGTRLAPTGLTRRRRVTQRTGADLETCSGDLCVQIRQVSCRLVTEESKYSNHARLPAHRSRWTHVVDT